ncbi:MAG: hypothetical protein AAFR38_01965 [Planctomycetota bacterium]
MRSLAGFIASLVATLSLAQEFPPQPSPVVVAATSAEYLTEDERRLLRIEHGLWEEDDLVTVRDRARAALLSGAIGDESLRDEGADALDRAEAALLRGDGTEALELTDGLTSLRAIGVRVRSLWDLGRFEEAAAAADPAADVLLEARPESASELASGVRALMVRAMVRGPDRAGGGDFQTLLALLKLGREQMDPLSWKVRLVEAELLYAKHNIGEAQSAAQEALARNPRLAAAMAVVGEVTVDGFNFAATTTVARELRRLAEEFDERSAFAGPILARASLRQRDPLGAGVELSETLASFPLHRRAVALDAAIAATNFEDEDLAAALDLFEQVAPGSPVALAMVGMALSEARQYDDSGDYLRRAIERLPNWPDPIIELGLMELQAGNDRAALEALERARELDRFNLRASNSLILVRELTNYDTVESDHFIVRFKPGVDEILATEMLPVLEEIHTAVAGPTSDGPVRVGEPAGGFDHEPDRKTIIELMPNHRWFSVRITGMTEIHTIAAATGPVIAMEAPREGPGGNIGGYDWPAVIKHEYAHTVTLSRTKNRIPHWFTEALAVYAESVPRDEDTWTLLRRAFDTDTLFDLEEINIAFVRPEKPTDRGQAYAQGHWMAQFIAENWTERTLLDLMDRYAEGQLEAEAFAEVLDMPREEFLSSFRAWAERDLRAHGLLPEQGAPSVRDLVVAERDRLPEELRRTWSPDADFARRTLVEHPEHPDALELAVELIVGRAPEIPMTQEQVDLLERYAAARPTANRPHQLLARQYLGSDDPAVRAEAVEHLEFLDIRERYTPAYAIALARRYAELEDWTNALAKIERATQIDPFEASTRELAASVAIQAGELEIAERHVRALVFLEPDREQHRQRLEAVRALSRR